MDLGLILTYLSSLHPAVPLVLAGLGSLVVLAQVYVALTPSPADNEYMARLETVAFIGPVLKGLKAFAPIRKKDDPQ